MSIADWGLLPFESQGSSFLALAVVVGSSGSPISLSLTAARWSPSPLVRLPVPRPS